MKKLIIIIIIIGLGLFLYARMNNVKILIDGEDIQIENGDNKFDAVTVSRYKKDLRIYGITDNNERGWSPLGYANYFFTASPYTGNTSDCERNDALNSSLINVIVEDPDVKNKIKKLKGMTDGRRNATVIGVKVYIKKYYYKDEDHTGALSKQGKLDPRNAIIIEDIVISE